MDFPEYGRCTGRRILLAAENETCGKRLGTYLVDKRYAVDIVDSGEQVIDRMVTGVFDLFILDFGLPGVSFESVIDAVGNVFIFTPMVVMVSNRKCALAREVAVVAPIYLMIKPFTLTDFGSVISSVVGNDSITVTTRSHRSIYNE